MLDSGRAATRDGSGALLLASARRVQADLPKRLARRLMDLQLLPFIAVSNPHIRQVYDAYRLAFDTLTALPPVETPAANAAFTALLKRLVDEHGKRREREREREREGSERPARGPPPVPSLFPSSAPMLDLLAAGLREVTARPFTGPRLDLDAFLEAMLRSRVSRRVLAEHHIGLASPRPGHVGAVCAAVDLGDAVDHAAARMRQACVEAYGIAPVVAVDAPGSPAIPHIPAHVDYCLHELLKNAARATVEAALRRAGSARVDPASLPPVRVRVCDAPGDGGAATVVVSDQGGGVPDADLGRVWRYGFTTVPADGLAHAASSPLAATAGDARYRLAGLGFGLPLSRLYARYFGGDLRLVSLRGHGVDAFLTLPHLVGDWMEAGGDDVVGGRGAAVERAGVALP